VYSIVNEFVFGPDVSFIVARPFGGAVWEDFRCGSIPISDFVVLVPDELCDEGGS
jgi:hypothetical protein